MNFKVRTKRTEQAKRVMCATDADEASRNHIKKYLKIQQYGNYAAKLLPIPFIYFLYTKNLFQLKSKSILRDLGVILGCIGWMEGCEFGLSKFMWMNVEAHVKAFGLMKRKEMESRYKSLIPKQRTELQSEDDFMEDYTGGPETSTSKA